MLRQTIDTICPLCVSGMQGPNCAHINFGHRPGVVSKIVQGPGHAHVGCAAPAMLDATHARWLHLLQCTTTQCAGTLSKHTQAVQHCSSIGTGRCYLQGCDVAWIGSLARCVSMADTVWPCQIRLTSLLSVRGGNLGSSVCSASHADQCSACETQPELLASNAAMTAVFINPVIACSLHALLQWQQPSAVLLASTCRSSMQT